MSESKENGEKPSHLWLVRHGETEWNRLRLWQGQANTRLNATGWKQARQLAQALRMSGVPFQALYSSDLSRAADTADAIGKAIGLTPLYWRDLREIRLGIFQGSTPEQFRQRHPEAYRSWFSEDLDYAVVGGESRREFMERTDSALSELADKHPSQTTLVVCHGGFIRSFVRRQFGLSFEAMQRMHIPNGSITRMTRMGGNWHLYAFSEIRGS